jgi:hypothetical protein
MPWNLDDLRSHARAMPDNAARVETLQVIQSIDRYVMIFRYHLATARDAMKGVVHETGEDAELRNLELIFGVSKQQSEFAWAKIVSEANILGCMHTSRALVDVLANLANRLVLRGAINLADCSIYLVAKKLPVSALKTRLASLLASAWFRYVSAFVNTAKHHNLIQHAFGVSFVGEGTGIRVEPFEYKGKSFPGYDEKELLLGILEVKNAIIDCGTALNDVVLLRT